MRYRLLATDIDGTLLDSSNRLRPAVREALGRVHRAGVRVVLCTGRRFRTTHEVCAELGDAADVVICSGGAAIKKAATGETLRSWPLVREVAQEICVAMRAWGLVPVALPDVSLARKEVLVSRQDADGLASGKYFAAHRDSIEFYDGEFPDAPETFLECYTCDLADKVGPACAEAQRRFGERTRVLSLAQIRYGADHLALEFMSREASKAGALAWLLATWRIGSEEVIAVGDDVNDVDMIELAGAGVAMGNAADAVRRVAQHQTLDHDHDGLAVALRRLLPEVFEA